MSAIDNIKLSFTIWQDVADQDADVEELYASALEMGIPAMVKRLFAERGEPPPNISRHTLLHLACAHPHASILRYLLEQRLDVHARTSANKDTPLHLLVQGQETETPALLESAEQLIRAGADVNAVNGSMKTPLHYAVEKGWINMAHFLLQQGAHVHARDALRRTPLHKAIQNRDVEMIYLLFLHGADPFLKDKYRQSCLGLIATSNSASVKNAALHCACLYPRMARIIPFLLKCHVDENTARVQDKKSLGKPMLSKTKVSVFLGVNATMDPYEETPLHLVLRAQGRCDIAAMLIKAGADVNAKNAAGRTPLHYAVHLGRCDLATLLVENGADPFIKCHQQNTCFDMALLQERSEIVHLFLQHPLIKPKEIAEAWDEGYETAFAQLKDWVRTHRALTEREVNEFLLLGVSERKYALIEYILRTHAVNPDIPTDFKSPAFLALMMCDERASALLPPDGRIKEAILRTVLGHVAGFDKVSTINGKRIHLNGARAPIMFDTIARALRTFYSTSSSLSARQKAILVRAFERAKSAHTGKEILEELNQNGLCIVESRICLHGLSILFYRPRGTRRMYCGICNAGERPQNAKKLHLFEIKPSLLTSEIIDRIQKYCFFKNKGYQFIYQELPQLLGAKSASQALIAHVESMAPRDQKHSTCAYTSAKCALRCAWALLALEGKSRIEFSDILHRVNFALREWSAFALERTLAHYRAVSKIPDGVLIRHAVQKLKKKREILIKLRHDRR